MKRLGVILGVLAVSSVFAAGLPAAGVLIHPDTSGSVHAGQTIHYPMAVVNLGDEPDVFDITITVTQPAWVHQILNTHGGLITDTDGDAIPDIGILTPMSADTVILGVTPPVPSLEGSIDTTTVYARSSVDPLVYDSAIAVTTVLPPDAVEEGDEDSPPVIQLVNSSLEITFNEPRAEETTIELFNILGVCVHQETVDGSRTVTDVSRFPQGVYFVSIDKGEDNRMIRKILIY